MEAKLFSRRPAREPLLSKKNIAKRLKFTRTHVHWSAKQWRTVLFSDESKFEIFSDGNIRVRRPNGRRLDPRYCKKTVKHGGGNVMVWGCFSASGVGPLHLINGKMDELMYRDIMENQMQPFAEWNMPLKWIFQQDNDPKHTCKLVARWSGGKISDLQPKV